MSDKKSTNYEIDKALSKIANPSVFDRLVKEVEPVEIPVKYIESIIVQYYDGNIVELKGDDISHPIPVNPTASWEKMEGSFKKMRDVRIFIATDKLEKDVNIVVKSYLGKYFD
jgi:hypothetical protein